MLTPELVQSCRDQFPALRRTVNGRDAAFFDGPGGTQTPQCVIDGVSNYLATMNANHEGRFATSRESDAMLHETHRAAADFLGASDPDTVYFGANMTSLTFALSRSLARTWSPGDEIIVTRLDHDANYSPWVLAARDAGAKVHVVELNQDNCTLDLDDLRSKLSERTKLVAVGCASNAVGTVNPVKQIGEWAHACGALVFLDAVHYAPHAKIEVDELGCDFLACSAYKFFGPHVGLMWGKRDLLEQLETYKLRPAPDDLPGRWMSGTQNHEGLAGTLEAIDYLADLGRVVSKDPTLDRRVALTKAFAAIGAYESTLTQSLLDRLAANPLVKVWGITDSTDPSRRLPTVAITHQNKHAGEIAEYFGQQGLFVWDGNYYAVNLTEALGLEPHGMVRIGMVHYNNDSEIERLIVALDEVGR